MRRALALLVRNWPLKLAALALAILLYAVLVVGQNARIFPGSIPIRAENEPGGVVLLSNLPNVTEVRYLGSDPNIRVDSTSFQAVANLSGIDPHAGTVSVPVSVSAVDDRIRVLGWSPDRVQLQLDRLVSRQVPVGVNLVQVPGNVDVRQPELSLETVTVTGPESSVSRVDHAEARIQIDEAGLDFDRDVELVAVDALDEAIPPPIRVEPAVVHVRIPVFTNRQTRSVPVAPTIDGAPAPGFAITAVTFDPLVVNIEGDADQLGSVTLAATGPVTVAGATTDVTSRVPLALPTGVLALGVDGIDVTVRIEPVTMTRTYSAGINVVGARNDRTYQLSTNQVLLTVSGAVSDLDALLTESLQVTVNVTGLSSGAHDVPVAANLPAGLKLVNANPKTIRVVVGLPSPSPRPATESPPPSAAP